MIVSNRHSKDTTVAGVSVRDRNYPPAPGAVSPGFSGVSVMVASAVALSIPVSVPV